MDRTTLETEFQRVLDEYGPALRRLAWSYERVPRNREDLFQEIALALWQALPRFRGECSLRTFVFRIAHNRSLRHVWQRRRRAEDGLEDVEIADPAAGPETRAASSERGERLREAIRALPLIHRQVLTLALEELSQAEMAEVLGISENAVAVRLSRARRVLRRTLEERT